MDAEVTAQPLAMEKNSEAPGKRLLMEAALRLTSTSRSLSSLGLRELAREAGLNPNTFYRHFRDVDDLGLAVIRDISTQLRQPLRALRREAAARADQRQKLRLPKLFGIDLGRGRRVTHETVQLFFDFVDQHPAAFLIGVRVGRYAAVTDRAWNFSPAPSTAAASCSAVTVSAHSTCTV